MPTYDYVCHKCMHKWEMFHGVNESGPTHCPQCRSKNIERLMSAPSVIFKGKGFYNTDYNPKSEPLEDPRAYENLDVSSDDEA